MNIYSFIWAHESVMKCMKCMCVMKCGCFFPTFLYNSIELLGSSYLSSQSLKSQLVSSCNFKFPSSGSFLRTNKHSILGTVENLEASQEHANKVICHREFSKGIRFHLTKLQIQDRCSDINYYFYMSCMQKTNLRKVLPHNEGQQQKIVVIHL